MKISKVGHTSTGVGKKDAANKTGMLYKNPSAQGKDARFQGEELAQRVEELNRAAKRLYNVFNQVKEFHFIISRDEETEWKIVRKNFSTIVNELVRKRNRAEQISLLRQLPTMKFTVPGKGETVTKSGSSLAVYKEEKGRNQELPKTQFAQLFANLDIEVADTSEKEDFLTRCADESIRKAYRKVVIEKNGQTIDVASVVTKLMIAMADQKVFDSTMKSLSDQQITAFLDILEKDYYKKEQLKQIVVSIQNKDTKVQVVEADGSRKLALSSYSNPKKQELFRYMVSYADQDTEERSKMREEMKAFIRKYLESGNSDGVVFSESVEEALKRLASMEKDEKKKEKTKIVDLVNREIVCKYQDTLAMLQDDDAQGKFWLTFFSQETEKWILEEVRKRNGISSSVPNRRLVLADIEKHLIKYFVSYLATKFIDMGKAVYHFTGYTGGCVGEILPEYQQGLTSFDYERITAEDSVKRDFATYVSFALNNFNTSVCSAEILKKNSDALSFEVPFTQLAKKNILRFFGGESLFPELAAVSDGEVVNAFRHCLAAIRNSTLHFDEVLDESRIEAGRKVIGGLFDSEYSRVGSQFAKKYYSNNVPMFYKAEKVRSLIQGELYRNDRIIVAGVPAFNRIVVRNEAPAFIKRWMGNETVNRVADTDAEIALKFYSALYFVLKEIYYYGFLESDRLMSYMDKALKDMADSQTAEKGKPEHKNYPAAYKNYQARYYELKNSGYTAVAICEQIMHDFSMQNNEEKEVLTAKDTKGQEKVIYEHFRMLLYKQIREAFLLYLNAAEELAFLKNPGNYQKEFENLSEEEFTKGIRVEAYGSAKRAVQNPEMLSWYAAAHFMNKRHINHLCGAIRTQIKYLQDIERRAKSTKNSGKRDISGELGKYQDILRVLEFALNFCELTSNKLTDYFEDENDYAEKLAGFVGFPMEQYTAAESLRTFCELPMAGSKSGRIGIFYDAENPVVNKNVVRATMYGNGLFLNRQVIRKVEMEDIRKYYELMDRANGIFAKVQDRTFDQQKLIRSYQNTKNRVELTNIASYVDIVNELYGQLLSWTYLRERDLTYMQMGYYYVKLFWGKSTQEGDVFQTYESKKNRISSGAILYLIRAIYSHSVAKETGINFSFRDFLKRYGEEGYLNGLELFENITLKDSAIHDEAVSLRNYIAHFHYFAQMDHSLEELYGDIFSMFFAYDRNLHKSVPVIYKNILAHHMMVADIEACESDSAAYSQKYQMPYKRTKWSIRRDETVVRKGMKIVRRGLGADQLTFKVVMEGNGKRLTPIEFPAHDNYFLEDVKRLLCYKE